ncbi:hypothetical protein HPTD01_2027 [Halomonas sp. TD01]|nr:hypothetical protein HPTD01_2027 [Halomonas sp. TD01]
MQCGYDAVRILRFVAPCLFATVQNITNDRIYSHLFWADDSALAPCLS